jgi:GNAT superfamily N-acetyltransferase
MVHTRLEEVAMNAWPALQQMLFDGWILRFAQGYTKRANSVNPLFESRLDVVDKIVVCERLFAAKGLPTVFRLTPFASPLQLDEVLAQRGYGVIDQTLVMHLDLQHAHVQDTPRVTVRAEALHDWLAIFCRLSEEPPAQHHTHAAMLDLIPATRLLASLSEAGTVVACGMGVLEQDYFGLFSLVTAPQQRNRGHGTRLVVGMLQWAKDHGATQAYLQVVQRNTPARHVYTKVGFQEAYRYWYRVSPVGQAVRR